MFIENINEKRELPFTKKQWESDLRFMRIAKNPRLRIHTLSIPAQLEFKKIDKEDFQLSPTFIAIDTETYASNGNLICLCNSKDDSVLLGSPAKSPSIKDYFEYLAKLQGTSRHTLFIVYNLKYDAHILLKSLGSRITSLYFGETADGTKYTGTFEGINIKYIPKKMLNFRKKISANKSISITIFDSLQFFLGSGVDKKSDLDSVATKYLGKHKEYDGKYQDKVFPNGLLHDKQELKKVIDYCRQDCILTQKIMDIWVKAFYDNFGFYPNKYHSAGTIALEYMKTRLNDFPVFKYAPYEVQATAFASYFGGRFEITERGSLENIYHYDIVSAYPHAMAEMPDFTNGKWVKINSLQKFKDNQDYVGFYEIDTSVNEQKISPFMVRGNLGLIYCPNGLMRTNTTSMELKQALDNYNVNIKRLNGYCFIPKKKDVKSEFNLMVEEMFKKRIAQTNEGQRYIYKVIINSLYGKTAQSKPEPKGIFSPIVCSYITAHTRAKLLDVAKNNKDDIVMFATDGIFSKSKLPKLELNKNKLGAFDFEFHPRFILLMAGIYAYNTKEKPDLKTKSRGFELKTINKKGQKVVFDIEQYDLTMKEGRFYYEIANRNSIPPSKIAMRHKGYSWQQIGKMELRRKEIDLNGDNKRLWHGQLTNINDYNVSEPFEADLIM